MALANSDQRGLHHPWFHRQASGADDDSNRELRWFHGVSHFDNAHLRSDAPHLLPSFRRLIDAFPTGELTIHCAPRVPRHHLPPTDFAMILALNFRHELCISARAARLLQREGLITLEDLSPLIVLDDVRPQVPRLETPVNASDYEDYFSRLSGEHEIPVAPTPKMEHTWTAETALAEARRELEKTREEHPLIPEREFDAPIKKAGMKIPGLWRQIILAAGEFGDVGDLYIPTPERWLEELEEYQERLAEAALNPTARYLYVGSNDSGDIYALELPARDSDVGYDAPLLFYDHEIFRFTKRWGSITRYLEESFRRE